MQLTFQAERVLLSGKERCCVEHTTQEQEMLRWENSHVRVGTVAFWGCHQTCHCAHEAQHG